MPSKEENARNGLPETDWRDAQYDMLYLPVTETVRYHYDFNGNRTATVLPDGRQINYLYYGSGHLHQISLDDEVITDIERDKLHREIFRTQGKLASRYELDPLGRLKRQIATLNDLTEGGKGKNKVAAGYNQTAVKRSYGYGRTGNLTHSTDQRTGTTHFEYDKLGRITKAGSELFAFDPAHNILDIPTEKVKPYPAPSPVGEGWGEGKTAALLSDDRSVITDNRLKTYNGTTYYYDDLGNLIHRELADGEVQNYFYDLHDHLVKAEIFKKDGSKETWVYTYDALGRRIGKGRLKNEEVSETAFPHDLSGNGLENHTRFVWDGSHLLQEIHSDGRYTYIYTDQDSYEPLAQVRDWVTEDGENCQQIRYFHCDQIGIPREMTDKDGNLLWFGNYTGWGRLKEETKVTDSAYQLFRLQNQYADRETGLHYNFFRYYEPDAGRFVNQDPIGLWGGMNFYSFASNIQNWIDFLGLATVDATFRIRGSRKKYTGTNPTERANRTSGAIECASMPGPNRDKHSMHAEVEAMTAAFDDGVRGGIGELTVKGKPVCGFCKSSLKQLARSLDLKTLIIKEMDTGNIYKFTGDELLPIKEGGKGYKKCDHC
ncbi:RHS repeat-associated core domain-containing protein [Neisseria macacae]|uniref:RHS domain-containing protein n=3 Tax=Neisseria TaxID=482 RepID=A0ABY3Y571_9NEIS|nr:RHS repeat-associated core domain-containing protein [Neisseria macacae]UNV83990.1 RHS domain-containing protein [Neisseria macacae ATCC 33926]